MLKVGFIGLGNVGAKLAGSLIRNGADLTVRDLNEELARPFLDEGAKWAVSPAAMARAVDVVITGVDGAIGIGIDLTGIVLSVEIAVRTRGLIDIASVGNAVTVEIVVAGIDGAV